ncbi:hypothetical protein ACWIGW_34985 [Nocardia brasiliensis]
MAVWGPEYTASPDAVAATAPKPGELPTAGTIPAPHRQLHVHPTSFVYTGDADPGKPGGIAEIYRALTTDEPRCRQIADDVLRAHKDGAHVLVLTRWVKHLTALANTLTAAGSTGVIQLKGGMKPPNAATFRPR